MTTVNLTAPDVAVVVELTNGSAVTSKTVPSTINIPTSLYVSHTAYSTLSAAFSAAQAIDANFNGVLLYGNLNLTEVNLSNSQQSFTAGSSATLNSEYSVDAGTITYQWYKDDQIIPDAEDSSLSTSSFSSSQVGTYSCVITATDTATAREKTLTRTFAVSETIVPPALTSATAFGIAAVDILTVNNAGTGYTVDALNVPTTGGSGTGLTVDITTDGDAILTATVNFPGEDYVDGETVTVSGDGNGDATLDITIN